MDDTPGVAGFSGDTEILTRKQGWITFGQLTCLDEVATRSPDGCFEWQHPEHVDLRRYDGDMVHLHSRTTDLMVTPGTRVLYMKRNRVERGGSRVELPYRQRSALAVSLLGQRLPLVATSRWEPDNARRTVTLTGTRAYSYGGRLANPGRDFSASSADFAAFMGMYLAEGSLSSPKSPGYYVWIWQQTAGKGFAEFQALLNSLLGRDVPWLSKKGAWHFSNKALWEYLRQCGGYAWTKTVPLEVLDLAADDLERFWNYYFLGDGAWMQAGSDRAPLQVIPTTSRQLAGSLQEILQKLGGWTLIQAVDFSKYESKLGASCHPTYRVVRRAGTVAFASRIQFAPHAGQAGHVGTGNAAVYVRRNYRPVWAGGSD